MQMEKIFFLLFYNLSLLQSEVISIFANEAVFLFLHPDSQVGTKVTSVSRIWPVTLAVCLFCKATS